MESAGDKEHSGGEDVQVVQLYAGDHRHHQQADELQEGEEGGEGGQEPVLFPGGVDAVVHGTEKEFGACVEGHHQGPDIALGGVTAYG